jgi:hypothetical protein
MFFHGPAAGEKPPVSIPDHAANHIDHRRGKLGNELSSVNPARSERDLATKKNRRNLSGGLLNDFE